MTPIEVRKRLDDICAALGGGDNSMCVCCQPKATMHSNPTSGSSTCWCIICGEECWHHLPSILDMCKKYGREHHIVLCGPCAEKSIIAEERQHTMLPNQTAAKATGATDAEVRAIEKQWAQRLGVEYQDPIQNN